MNQENDKIENEVEFVEDAKQEQVPNKKGAEQELEKAETTYDRLLYEEGTLATGMRELTDYKLESAIRKIKRFASKHKAAEDPRSLEEQH